MLSTRLPFGKVLVELGENLQRYIDRKSGFNQHVSDIIEHFFNSPLPLDNDLTLSNVYISPSAKYWSDKHSDRKSSPEDHSDIIDSILKIINESTNPIVIHGQPGHGKTSLARALMCSFAYSNKFQEPKITPIMFEFRDLGKLVGNPLSILNQDERTPNIPDKDFFS